MNNSSYEAPQSERIVSKTSMLELEKYREQAKQGKHFDESRKLRVGSWLYPSCVFPLDPKIRGKKALVGPFPQFYSLELAVVRLAEETNRLMDPANTSKRRIEASKTYPIEADDLIQIAIVGFSYTWTDKKQHYVDFFRDHDHSKIPVAIYKMLDINHVEKKLGAKPFADEKRKNAVPEDLSAAIKQAQNLGEFELPDGTVKAVCNIATEYEIDKVYAQIQLHIKYSDRENREKSQDSIDVENLVTKEGESFSEMFEALRKNTPSNGRLAKLAAMADAGETKIIETGLGDLDQEIDPNAETQVAKPTKKAAVPINYLKDPAFWNLLQESSETKEFSPEDMEFRERMRKMWDDTGAENAELSKKTQSGPNESSGYDLLEILEGKQVAEPVGNNQTRDKSSTRITGKNLSPRAIFD